jgi:tetratricopeptide (TPR) repeat protein
MNNTNNMMSNLQQLFQEKQFEKIIKETNQINLDMPAQSSILLIRATAFMEMGNINEAKDIFIDILTQRPGDMDASIGLAQIYFKAQEFEKAKHILNSLLNENPENEKLKQFSNNIEKTIGEIELKEMKAEKESEKSRFLSPLQAAFNQSEIKESTKNLQEREKIKLEKELKNPPIPPRFEPEILAEEWYLAGRDAFRDGQNEVAFLMCIKAAENNGNLASIYSLAGDIYLSNKNHNAAHLCYLLASQHGELDSIALVNLISLAATTGDKMLAHKRFDELKQKIPKDSPLAEEAEKMTQRIDKKVSIYFHPQFGPINSSNLSQK